VVHAGTGTRALIPYSAAWLNMPPSLIGPSDELVQVGPMAEGLRAGSRDSLSVLFSIVR